MRRGIAATQVFRLVQRKSDGRYYASDGLWTEHFESARMFQSAMQALRECEDLSDMSGEIVFVSCPEQGEVELQLMGR
jgi:hypothetical protein